MAQFRGGETPMEFEFQNKTGPLDARSPFAMVGQNAQRFASTQTPTKKRNPNAFESPARSLQSSPNKPLPSVPAFNALYNTPRKMNNEMDDSSAGETPQSRAADSDATPENVRYRSALSRFDSMSMPALSQAQQTQQQQRTSPSKSPAKSPAKTSTKEKERPPSSSSAIAASNPARRESIFGKLKSKLYSPGRGEVPRADYSQAMEKRVRKRRDRELHRHVARRRRPSMSDYSGDESERAAVRSSPRKTSRTKQRQADEHNHRGDNSSDDASAAAPKTSPIAALFAFIAQHPTVPHILSFYAQLLFNVFLLAGCAWVIYCFWAAVQGDVDKKSQEAIADVMAEMQECARQWRENRCEPERRVPAVANVCDNWAKCMARDPARVGRAKVSVHVFAEIFNSFVEPISYKAMFFTFILVLGCFVISNLAFGILRDKSANTHYGPPPSYYGAPPPTPQRSFSGQDSFGTPWQQQQHMLSPYSGMEPQPSAGAGGNFAQIEGRGSPVKRLVYN